MITKIIWKLNMLVYGFRFWLWQKLDDLNIEKHVRLQIQHGLVYNDLCPKRCFCGCKEFNKTNQYHEEYFTVEYQLECNNCGEKVGHWAFGYWQV